VTERERDLWGHEETLICQVCGASNGMNDRFCAECGALLASTPADAGSVGVISPLNADAVDASHESRKTDQENAVWVIGARPTAVMVGGILLLVLAAALLAVGQRDDTGTIVMLSICTAPLGLMVLVIGIARYIVGAARRGS